MPAMASSGQGSERLNAQLLVDSIPALIHTARPDGYLDYFNKPWLEYLGVTLDKVTGWNWTAVVHPEDVEGMVAKWRACLVSGEIFEYETRVRREDGEYRWMFHRKVPLRDANGNIVKWYGSRSFPICPALCSGSCLPSRVAARRLVSFRPSSRPRTCS